MNTDEELPWNHPLYRRYVFDTLEGKWYDRNTDLYLEEEDRVAMKLPTYSELIAEKRKS